MSEEIIIVEEVSKVYRIGRHQKERYVAFRDVITREFVSLARNVVSLTRGRLPEKQANFEEFWALRDVNFTVRRGEVLGLIGRNGAGKSTILKLLSRITQPTKGRIELRGRVASLLEVGTGFHPELTGRENIFLNGAILGMTKSEIRRRFDEIVDFAEIEAFLETPVKRYSSGMYVRLAFAIAAHLDPEILIVDEVLAVGDAEFQKKCLGKMDDIAHKQGRTVLFVSHDVSAVVRMAENAVYLVNGQVAKHGPVAEVANAYMARGGDSTVYESPFETLPGRPYIKRLQVFTSNGEGIHEFGQPLAVEALIRYNEPINPAYFAFYIHNQFFQRVIHAYAYYPDIEFGASRDHTLLRCVFPKLKLNVGIYSLSAILSGPPGLDVYDVIDKACSFEVIRSDFSIPWGWRADACTFYDEMHWSASESDVEID